MTIDKLLSSFDNYLPLDAAEREDLASRVTERKIKRRQFILQENDVCKHYTFVAEGCFKKFQVDDKGTEHNLWFAAELEASGLEVEPKLELPGLVASTENFWE